MTKKTSGYLLIAFAIAVVFVQYYRYRIAPDFEINELNLITAEGKIYPIQFNKKKLCAIIYFTTWCGSCHAEFKSIERAAFNGKAKDINFIAITDESIEKLQNYINVYGYPQTTFLHSPKNVGNIGIRSFPTVYIYNDKGKLLYSKVGAIDWNDSAFISTLANK